MVIATAPRLSAPITQHRSSRDTAIDFVRALCVVGVVLLHAMMVGVTVTSSGPVFENASDGTAWIAPLSWILQVMPLFFVIGGFSGLLAYGRLRERGGTASEFIAGRIRRLLLPAVVTIGIVGVALVLLAAAGVPLDLLGVAGFRYSQPLWFLAVFLLCQALLPALAAAHRRAPLRSIGALVALAVLVDAVRAMTGVEAIGFLNLAFVWMALQQLGFFFADGSIDALRRSTRILIGGGAVVALIFTFLAGIYSPDLIYNINPPTAAMVLVGVAHTAALSLFRDRLERYSRRPRPAAFTAFVTRRTMTIYLWHMPVLLAMAGASAVFALWTGIALPVPNSLEWWLARPLWLAVALTATALVAMVFARIENQRMPDGTRSRRRIAVATLAGLIALLLLLIFSTTVVTATIAVALILVALHIAQPQRRTAGPARQARQLSAPSAA
jgi:peptidoglycan/LPS O-acetylase OafA/YrhL